MRRVAAIAMLATLLGGAVGAAVAGTAWAGQARPAQRAAEMLKAEIPLVRFYEEGSRITRIYGVPLAFGVSPENSAEEFVFNYAEVFGVAPEDLELAGFPGASDVVQPVMFEQDTGEYKFFLVRYAQDEDGIPVFRADLRLLVRNLPDFPLVLVASSLRDLGDFAPDLSVLDDPFDPAQHVSRYLEGLSSLTGFDGTTTYPLRLAEATFDRFSAPEPVIWAGVNDMVVEPRLAYTIIAERGTPQDCDYLKWLFVVDAQSGGMLYQESRIIFEDVVGNVSGMATTIPKSAPCNPEELTPMRYARVYIQGGASTYADESGDFVIPNGGSSQVTVVSPMSGHYFYVDNVAGGEETLSEDVIPPGPVDFTHNEANTDELVQAQVNGYVQANIVRDFALIYNPDYPVIHTQTSFLVRVNRTDWYCPGNAWYDGSSINFCRAGSGYPNTAYSSIVHHEYGHHLVECAPYAGQDAYGEGMSDSVAVLIADDPVLGYGFTGNCNVGLRNADNDMQYPCYGEIHYCGQLLAGCIWSTREELAITHPDDEALEIISNLTINSILLHYGGSITPTITVDFLTLDDRDGDIYNGTPHAVEICAGFGAHNMDCPDINFGPQPPWAEDGEVSTPANTPVTITLTADDDGLPEPPHLDFIIGALPEYGILSDPQADVIESVPYTLVEGGNQVVYAPDTWFLGEDYLQFYVNDGGEPPEGGNSNVATVVIDVTPPASELLYEFPLDSDPGWSTEGQWAFGQPTGGGTHNRDPVAGYTGANVYGYNLLGDYINNMSVYFLTTPAINCDELLLVELRFWRWLGVERSLFDSATVEVSNDGANWTEVWANPGDASVYDSSWTQMTLDISAVADRQSTVYVRWTMGPTDYSNTYPGWNIDDIEIWAVVMAPPCPGDLDGDNDIDLADLSILLANYGMTSGAEYADGDLDGDDDVDLTDLSRLLAVYGTTCG